MSSKGLPHGCSPQWQHFLQPLPSPPILQERGSAPQSIHLLAPQRKKKSLNYCTQLLAFASRCASETKITGPGSLSSAQEGSPAALLGILGGAILKCKREEVQQLTSIVGLVHEEGGPSPFRRTQILLKSKLAVTERLRALPSADAKAAWIHWHQC